jgi:hypothetical protein
MHPANLFMLVFLGILAVASLVEDSRQEYICTDYKGTPHIVTEYEISSTSIVDTSLGIVFPSWACEQH